MIKLSIYCQSLSVTLKIISFIFVFFLENTIFDQKIEFLDSWPNQKKCRTNRMVFWPFLSERRFLRFFFALKLWWALGLNLNDSVKYLSDRLFKCKFRTGRVLKSMGRLIVVNAKTETIIFYELEVLNQCKNIKMSKRISLPRCIFCFNMADFIQNHLLLTTISP